MHFCLFQLDSFNFILLCVQFRSSILQVFVSYYSMTTNLVANYSIWLLYCQYYWSITLLVLYY